MKGEKPYWEMSQIEFSGLSKYDWIYKNPPPKFPPPTRISLTTGKPDTRTSPKKK